MLQEPGQHAAKAIKLKNLKAKIIRLNNSYRQRVMLDTTEQDRIDGEPPSLHHIIKTRKRQTNLLIDHSRWQQRDSEHLHIDTESIFNAFSQGI